jgi:hypothetical protein
MNGRLMYTTISVAALTGHVTTLTTFDSSVHAIMGGSPKKSAASARGSHSSTVPANGTEPMSEMRMCKNYQSGFSEYMYM